MTGENVKGLLTMGGGSIIKNIAAEFGGCGYDVFYSLLNAKDFGVPQDRERVIIAGFRQDLHVKGFKITPPGCGMATLRDAIGQMPAAAPEDVCSAPYSPRYMSRNRKRGWDEASYTIPAMAKQAPLWPGSPDMVKVGPDEWRFGPGAPSRRLSWREAAAIQTFPKGMAFHGGLSSVYRQIGNAVPPKLAEHIGICVRLYIN